MSLSDKIEEIGEALERFNDSIYTWADRLIPGFALLVAVPFALFLLYVVYGFLFMAIFDPALLRPAPAAQQTQAENPG